MQRSSTLGVIWGLFWPGLAGGGHSREEEEVWPESLPPGQSCSELEPAGAGGGPHFLCSRLCFAVVGVTPVQRGRLGPRLQSSVCPTDTGGVWG